MKNMQQMTLITVTFILFSVIRLPGERGVHTET